MFDPTGSELAPVARATRLGTRVQDLRPLLSLVEWTNPPEPTPVDFDAWVASFTVP